jgi:hypothetical protein
MNFVIWNVPTLALSICQGIVHMPSEGHPSSSAKSIREIFYATWSQLVWRASESSAMGCLHLDCNKKRQKRRQVLWVGSL